MSKKPKLTPWFNGSIAPARPGVYERRMPHGESPDDPSCYGGFAYWNGSAWAGSWDELQMAVDHSHELSGFRLTNESVWRGLAENPAPGATQETQP